MQNFRIFIPRCTGFQFLINITNACRSEYIFKCVCMCVWVSLCNLQIARLCVFSSRYQYVYLYLLWKCVWSPSFPLYRQSKISIDNRNSEKLKHIDRRDTHTEEEKYVRTSHTRTLYKRKTKVYLKQCVFLYTIFSNHIVDAKKIIIQDDWYCVTIRLHHFLNVDYCIHWESTAAKSIECTEKTSDTHTHTYLYQSSSIFFLWSFFFAFLFSRFHLYCLPCIVYTHTHTNIAQASLMDVVFDFFFVAGGIKVERNLPKKKSIQKKKNTAEKSDGTLKWGWDSPPA